MVHRRWGRYTCPSFRPVVIEGVAVFLISFLIVSKIMWKSHTAAAASGFGGRTRFIRRNRTVFGLGIGEPISGVFAVIIAIGF